MIFEAIKNLCPTAHYAVLNDSIDEIIWYSTDIPQPSNEQILAENAKLIAEVPLKECKEKASALLYETDWTTIADVADPANTPYLTNQAEFIAWRSQIRALAVNPVVDPVFPPKPTEIWG